MVTAILLDEVVVLGKSALAVNVGDEVGEGGAVKSVAESRSVPVRLES